MNLNQDYVHPFIFPDADIQGQLVSLSHASHTIITRHELADEASSLMGRLLALNVALAMGQKQAAILTLSLHGEGGLFSQIVSDVRSQGRSEKPLAVRASYQSPHSAAVLEKHSSPAGSPSLDLATLLGEGYFMLTLDPYNGPRSQAIIALHQQGLDQAADEYFQKSVQLGSWIMTSCQKYQTSGKKQQWRAACLLLQQLPKANQAQSDEERRENWQRINALASTLLAEELCGQGPLIKALDSDKLLWQLFHQETIVTLPKRKVKAQCTCSLGRMRSILAKLPVAERLDLQLPMGGYQVACQFCNQSHFIKEEELSHV